MDINKFIFSRTAPAKKIEVVESLNQAELLRILPTTISKMLKEAGTRLYKSRDKELSISCQRRAGNNWNSTIEGIRHCKGNLMLDLYIQFENTDTYTSVSSADFLKSGDYRGSIVRNDRYGNPRSYYFTYSPSDKAQFVKHLLLEYLERRYKVEPVKI